LIHISINKEKSLRDANIDLASNYVADVVFEKMNGDYEEVVDRLAFTTQSRLKELSWRFFERLGHIRIAAGGNFKVFNLDNKDKVNKIQILSLPSSKIQTFSSNNEFEKLKLEQGVYYHPSQEEDFSNFKSVDGFALPNRVFNMTISVNKTVPVPTKILKKFAIKESKLDFYFVTHLSKLNQFNGQFKENNSVMQPQPLVKYWVLGLLSKYKKLKK
jgi:hypothetical protein